MRRVANTGAFLYNEGVITITMMNFFKLIAIAAVLGILGIDCGRVFAQNGNGETGECTTKETCQTLLDKYEALLRQYDSDITKTAGEKKTLQNQIAALKKKTEALSVQIKQSNAMIGELSIQIVDTEASVENTAAKIAETQKHLAAIVRAIDEADRVSLIETLLAGRKFSDFFDNMVYLESLNRKSGQVDRKSVV